MVRNNYASTEYAVVSNLDVSSATSASRKELSAWDEHFYVKICDTELGKVIITLCITSVSESVKYKTCDVKLYKLLNMNVVGWDKQQELC
jgi:hypothetical protein